MESQLYFYCLSGPDKGKRVVLTKDAPIAIGKNINANILSDDPFVTDEYVGLTLLDSEQVAFNCSHGYNIFVDGASHQSCQIIPGNQQIRIGSSIWKFISPDPVTQKSAQAANKFGSYFQEKITNVTGVSRLEGFKLGHIFSSVFKKRSDEEIEKEFIVGTSETTPSITNIDTNWAKPWVFFRLLILSIGVFLLFYYAFVRFNNQLLVPGLIFVGTFAIPFSCLIFFIEMHAPRNISLYQVIKLMFIGGIISLIISLLLFDLTKLSNWLSASAAGIVEEAGKLITVVLLMANKKRYPWIFNGLLLGASVGTGFAIFESAGYAFLYGLNTLDNLTSIIIARGVFSPFAHIIWTAAAAGAFWKVKGSGNFKWEIFSSSKFLKVLAAVMILHMLWNAPFGIPLFNYPLSYYLKYLLLGIIGWIIVLGLMQDGLKQLNQAREDSKLE
ncbi:PrsW family glutamic-type intramembrane protease [Fulvivirgaceae bacterium BMA10]|uniref:PrsW family glutamic-type intramembrane protease n=1 Tax=Splendidivirga corallicola TaxID=3051826 RepID=A0ABT8KUV7_9BACT|nr:PrsW family glutamic-type intramembrane protease [Fulvivirgaceae bacterium BMA10]